MRGVQREIEEEGLLCILLKKTLGFANHQIREIFTRLKDLRAVPPQIMAIRPRPIKEVRVVIDTASAVPEKLIKPLGLWVGLRRLTQVPFAD